MICRLAYLHEAIEPKVVHRDIKSSNILIDEDFNGKLSDFGLAKMLGAGKSHITTRVMGTFGYATVVFVIYNYLAVVMEMFDIHIQQELLNVRRFLFFVYKSS